MERKRKHPPYRVSRIKACFSKIALFVVKAFCYDPASNISFGPEGRDGALNVFTKKYLFGRCFSMSKDQQAKGYIPVLERILNMGCTTLLRKIVLSIACLGLLLQTPLAMAAATSATASKAAPVAAQAKNQQKVTVFDVGLHKDNTLIGQLVNTQGVPQAKQKISLIQKKRILATATTDKNGYFAFAKVAPGTYSVVAPKSQGICRVWAPKTAPPSSQLGLLMVEGKGAVRAQEGPIAYWLGKPWVIAGLVGAAVAIPVAIHNHQNDKSPVSP